MLFNNIPWMKGGLYMIEPVAIYYEHCEPGWRVPSSATRNHILVLVTEGEATFETTANRFVLGKGDLLFLPQGIERHAYNAESGAHEMFVAHFRYAGTGDGLPLLTGHEPLKVRPMNEDYLRYRFSALNQYWLRNSAHAATLCHSALLELLALLSEEAVHGEARSSASGIIYKLEEYVLGHYRQPITNQELADYVGKTPNYVSSLYKKTTGRTLTDYMQRIRVSAACDLLTTSEMNIGEISDYLGFCEQSYFYKVFKRVTGSLPSEYVRHNVDRTRFRT